MAVALCLYFNHLAVSSCLPFALHSHQLKGKHRSEHFLLHFSPPQTQFTPIDRRQRGRERERVEGNVIATEVQPTRSRRADVCSSAQMADCVTTRTMASKKRWTLMPKKWFGPIAHAAQKRDRERRSQLDQLVTPVGYVVPQGCTGRNQAKVTPIALITEDNPTEPARTTTRFHLPAFSARRKKPSSILPIPSAVNPTQNLDCSYAKPSIQKYPQLIEPLSMYMTRPIAPAAVQDTIDVLVLPPVASQRGPTRCDQTNPYANRRRRQSTSLTRTHSSSSAENNDCSSSGVFSEQRADGDERQQKDASSTVEILSVDSLNGSRASLDDRQSPPPPVVRYRLSIPTLEPLSKPPLRVLNQSATIHYHRAPSVERIARERQKTRSTLLKAHQSSAAIVKKIEKRLPLHRSPPSASEKTISVRLSNDTCRSSSDKENHLYRRQRPHSIVSQPAYDDSLPSANDENWYAHVPRSSSTEQVHNNLQNDLRAIVDDYLRPMVDAVDQPAALSADETQNSSLLENITDKLLSSMDSSIYAQYQRCC